MQMNSYEAQLMVRVFIEERQREADRQRLLRQVHSAHPGWFLAQGLRFLHRLGCMLVALGHSLQQSASAPTGALGSENGGSTVTGQAQHALEGAGQSTEPTYTQDAFVADIQKYYKMVAQGKSGASDFLKSIKERGMRYGDEALKRDLKQNMG